MLDYNDEDSPLSHLNNKTLRVLKFVPLVNSRIVISDLFYMDESPETTFIKQISAFVGMGRILQIDQPSI